MPAGGDADTWLGGRPVREERRRLGVEMRFGCPGGYFWIAINYVIGRSPDYRCL